MGEVLTRVLSTLAARFAGTPARVMVAGGAVRDFVLGLPPRDIDLLIESELRDETEILRVLALLSGMEPVVFDRRPPATHRVVVEGVVVDTSFCRPGALVGALERRDFTLNAMALPLAFAVPALESLLVDPFGGLADLRAGRIRPTTGRSLDDDPLRMLRAVRLASTLPGFALDESLAGTIRESAGRLVEPAAERVQAEMEIIFRGPRAGEAVRSMDALGLLAPIFPELQCLRGLEQPARHHDHDALEHSLRAVEAADDLAGGCPELGTGALSEPDRTVLKWAALFHDVGKAATAGRGDDGELHFYGHETVSASLAERAFARLRVPSRIGDPAVRLIDLHLRLGALASAGAGERPIRRVVRAAGDTLPLLTLLSLADRRSSGGERSEERTTALVDVCRRALAVRDDVEAALSSPPLLDGREIMSILGLAPGPRVGSVARWLERLRAERAVSTREEAEALLRSLPPARVRDGRPRRPR